MTAMLRSFLFLVISMSAFLRVKAKCRGKDLMVARGKQVLRNPLSIEVVSKQVP